MAGSWLDPPGQSDQTTRLGVAAERGHAPQTGLTSERESDASDAPQRHPHVSPRL